MTNVSLSDMLSDKRLRLLSLIWGIVQIGGRLAGTTTDITTIVDHNATTTIPTTTINNSTLLLFDDDCMPLDDMDNDTITELIMRSIFNDQQYDKNTVPSKRGTTVVVVEFVIQNIAELSEITSSFTIDLLFRFDRNCLLNNL